MENSNTMLQDVKTLAQTNETAKMVFETLAGRERFRRKSDLNRFQLDMIKRGLTIEPKSFMDVFKKLEALHLGRVVHGKNGNSNRFVWHVNLKWLGKTALERPMTEEETLKMPEKVEPKKRGRGRPKGSKNKKKAAGRKPSPSKKRGPGRPKGSKNKKSSVKVISVGKGVSKHTGDSSLRIQLVKEVAAITKQLTSLTQNLAKL